MYGFGKLLASSALLMAAFSSSSTYQLQNYGLGSGGTNNASSPTYRLNASSGEVGTAASSGSTTKVGSGTTQVRQANVPAAPTLSNGSNTYYNKLAVVINKSSADASDYVYSIAVSTDNFATTTYVQADGTLAPAAFYQSYSAWGGSSGSFIIGLGSNTAYKAKANARQGSFTESAYGADASATTANPALTFSASPSTVSLGNLLPATVTTGGSSLTFGFATNAAAGGSVYVAGLNAGLRSATAANTISSASVDLSSQAQGFGLVGLTATQTSGGTLAYNSPYNGSGSNVGIISTGFRQLLTTPSATVGGSATAAVKGKSATTTPSGTDYSETLTFIAAASF